jgi:uncharacterized protein (TIGR02001 family)
VIINIIVAVGTALAASIAEPARAQIPETTTRQASAGGISLGARGWGARERVHPAPGEREPTAVEFSAKAGIASDYIYRGTTLSDRKPAIGAGVEATYGWLYAGATAATVKLPTNPSAELTFAGGLRPSFANIDFDFGAIYFLYPGETPGSNVDYWEASARADTTIGQSFRAAGGFAYSPNVSNTGAWGWYAAAGLGYEVPARVLPFDVSVLITGAAGYSWFGNQSLALGGFELPAYLNWHAGITITHKLFNLDLRYYDTDLSKENCFVFTGDPNARPGGRIDPITNPAGLMSNWCSATFVAKAWVELN